MRISPTKGNTLMGAGGGQISINGVLVEKLKGIPAGNWAWLDDDRCVGQAAVDGPTAPWRMCRYNLATDTLTSALEPNAWGADQTEAGNGRYAAWWGHVGAGAGLRTSSGGSWPSAGRPAVSSYNGLVWFPTNYQNPVELSCAQSDDTTLTFPAPGTIWGLAAAGDFCVYSEGTVLKAVRVISGELVPVPVRGLPTLFFRVALLNDVLYIVANGDRGLVVYPLNQASGPINGWILSTDGQDYNPDIEAIDGGLKVASSRTQAEGPADARIYRVDPASAMVPLSAPLGRPLFVAPFFAWNDRADYGKTDVPTNAEVLDTASPGDVPGDKWFLGDNTSKPYLVEDRRFIGYYNELPGGSTDPEVLASFKVDLDAAVAAGVDRQRPVYVDFDADWNTAEWFVNGYLKNRATEIIPMVEFYPIKNLGADDIVKNWVSQIQFLQAHGFQRLAAIPSMYTQSSNYPIALIPELQPRMMDLVKQYPIVLVAPFSIGRPSGVITYHDFLWPWLQAWASFGTVGAVPQLLVKGSTPVSATITISSYAPSSGDKPLSVVITALATNVPQIEWQYKPEASDTWVRMALTPGNQPVYTAVFHSTGRFNIRVRGCDASGNPIDGALTTSIRTVVVNDPATPPPVVPPPTSDKVGDLLNALQQNVTDLKKELGR